MAGGALIPRGAARFWERLAFDWRTIPTLHSHVGLDDLSTLLQRAERFLGQLTAAQ